MKTQYLKYTGLAILLASLIITVFTKISPIKNINNQVTYYVLISSLFALYLIVFSDNNNENHLLVAIREKAFKFSSSVTFATAIGYLGTQGDSIHAKTLISMGTSIHPLLLITYFGLTMYIFSYFVSTIRHANGLEITLNGKSKIQLACFFIFPIFPIVEFYLLSI